MHGIAWRGLRHLEIFALGTSASTLEEQLDVRNAFILMNASPQVYLINALDRRMAFPPGVGLVVHGVRFCGSTPGLSSVSVES